MRIEAGGSSSALILSVMLAWLPLFSEAVGLSPDGQALLALKSGINDTGAVLVDWVDSSTGNPCNWTAVQCDSSGNVVALDVSGHNLTGNISAAIGSLTHLASLNLGNNNFSGPLPQELSGLTSLQSLNVSDNSFSGGLPVGLSNLSRLEVLDCYNNYLSGMLPIEVVSLRSLRKLHLGGNEFSGAIPREYGNLTSSLEYMSLGGNHLTGAIPAELGNLTGLRSLYLGWWNSFESEIPAELGKLRNLVLLDLSVCQLTGSIPGELSGLTRLESLFLFGNNLSGSLPPELGTLGNLQSLDVSSNNLSGIIPKSYSRLDNLTLLHVFQNRLVGLIPAGFVDLPRLSVLQVWKNNFTGEIPQKLGRTGSLVKLDVSDNQLTGELPLDLCAGGKLETLITMDNNLSGPIPDGVGSCTSLTYLRLHGNHHTGPIPPGFFTLVNLTMLQLHDNYFTGAIPSVIRAPLLRTLSLERNRLEGTIPKSMGDLASLQVLHLGGNRLTGNIPSTLCDLPLNLYEISLGSNYLGGNIPSSLANCHALSMLDLSWNNMSGPIPDSLLGLNLLAVLDLSNNQLSGPIPPRIGLIQSLTQVNFSYNNLSGPIPTAGDAANYNAAAFVGNPYLCGGKGLPACSGTAKSPNGSDEGKMESRGEPRLLAWLVGTLFSAAFLVLFVSICCFCRKYQYDHVVVGMFKKEGTVRPWKFTPFQRLDFTAMEIVDCLSEENVIGKGGAGTVYRGEMSNGEMVAVKRLACGKGGTMTTHDHGFSAEIQTLGKIRHRYIVRLLGFCTNNQVNLLVYEYMPNGSLGEFLHDGKRSGLLDWAMRYTIAVQAATGLCYLHHDCSPLILHRDVKSNNILLDSNLGAHVADFGLAKLFHDGGKSESMSSIAGSYGYIAPEYAYTLKVNEKSDIYSFGVVLMELLTGKRPIEPDFGDGVDLVQWVRMKIHTKEGVMEVLDPAIGGSDREGKKEGGGAEGDADGGGSGGGLTVPVPLPEVMLVLRVALLCCSDHPVDRPTMRDVVQMLSDVRPGGGDGARSTGSLDSLKPLLPDDLLTF